MCAALDCAWIAARGSHANSMHSSSDVQLARRTQCSRRVDQTLVVGPSLSTHFLRHTLFLRRCVCSLRRPKTPAIPDKKIHAFWARSGRFFRPSLSTPFSPTRIFFLLFFPVPQKFCFVRKAEETVRLQLGLPHLVTSLTDLLEETDVQLYLAGLVILGKVISLVAFSLCPASLQVKCVLFPASFQCRDSSALPINRGVRDVNQPRTRGEDRSRVPC